MHPYEREAEGKRDEKKMRCDDEIDVWICYAGELKDGGKGHEPRIAALEGRKGKGTLCPLKSPEIVGHCWHRF